MRAESLQAGSRSAEPGTDPRAAARQVACQFEQLLVRTLVGGLRETAKVGGEGSMFGDGPGADTYADWFDQNLAEQLSRSGHVGVADVLMREFERWRQLPTGAGGPHAAAD